MLVPAARTKKVIVDGTHRTKAPEETWEWIKPVLPRVGITRIADVTWLDTIGISVYQAIRPNSWSLSVSQGKGVTPLLARISAVMEGIEVWHAERPALPSTEATVGEMRPGLGYDPEELTLAERHFLHDDCRVTWLPAQSVDTGTPTHVPAQLLVLDGRVSRTWEPPLFYPSSNGLASGNTLDEALLHGMYEVIERDAIVRAAFGGDGSRPQKLDLSTVDAPSVRTTLELFGVAGVNVSVRRLPSQVAVPTFDAIIWDDAFPVSFRGIGSHLDAAVALSRALTEAAQSRTTAIAGSRDDLGKKPYRSTGTPPAARPSYESDRLDFTAVESVCISDTAEEVREVTGRILNSTGAPPVYVNLTRDDIGVPVALAVCPGMRYKALH
ncbi:YcaO-like family protein [Micromonospora sp. NPDC048830]|uniref:YcaO-like family protein n=1 Tax=Micromonospora sp. NPDC048830 TaxID=3364257 RepID=UPI0037178203